MNSERIKARETGEFAVEVTNIKLHIDPQKTLLLVVVFSVVGILINVLIGLSVNSNCANLLSLSNSSYEYSAITDRILGQDDYLQFDAGVYFSIAENSKKSLNADIVMQSNESEYSDIVCWNAERLCSNEIAISYNISQRNKKEVGDKLYSRYVVDGTVQEYIITQILPDMSTIRFDNSNNYSNGVIIMSYNREYAENFSHSNIVYTNKSISELVFYNPQNVLYREDEMLSAIKSVSPYLAVSFVLSIFVSIVLVLFLSSKVKCNFRRQMILGFEKKKLDYAYDKYICIAFLCYIILTIVLSLVAMRLLRLNSILSVIYGIGAVIEIIVMLITEKIVNGRFWR